MKKFTLLLYISIFSLFVLSHALLASFESMDDSAGLPPLSRNFKPQDIQEYNEDVSKGNAGKAVVREMLATPLISKEELQQILSSLYIDYDSIAAIVGVHRIIYGYYDERSRYYDERPLCAVMAGEPIYVESKEFGGQKTYARRYEPTEEGCNLRRTITQAYSSYVNRADVTKIIAEYRSRHSCSECQGYSFSEKLEEGSALNCLEYALSTYKPIFLKKVEGLLDIKLDQRTSWERLINLTFTCVNDEPQNGDLVVYYKKYYDMNTKKIEEIIQHFGIFRTNGSSASQGTIKSQWGLKGGFDSLDPYICETPPFLSLVHYGAIVKFYRVKNREFL